MKKNLYFFVSLVFALSAVCACSSDDDDVDTSDCYTCSFIFDNRSEVFAYILDTNPAYNPSATNADGVPAPGKGDGIYFHHLRLGDRQFKYGDTMKLRILKYKLDDCIHAASREMDNTGNVASTDHKTYICDVELVK